MFAQDISYWAALLAGVLSFFSPCIVPLIPAYFSFISGYSLEDLTRGDLRGMRKRVIFSTLSFVVGFSLVFIFLGASASFFGGLLVRYKDIIRIVGGALIIAFGLHVSGLVRLRYLEFEKRVELRNKPVHIFGSLLVGMAFGAGWSPCIGPLLGSILIIAGSQQTVGQGILLLGIYSAGLAVPFLGISVFIGSILSFLSRVTHALKYVNASAGILLVAVGVLLIVNRLNFFL